MKRVEELPRIAEQALGGLVAGPALKERILQESTGGRRRVQRAAWVPALCCAVALAVGLSFGLPRLTQKEPDAPMLRTLAAGDGDVTNEQSLSALGNESLNVTSSRQSSSFRSLWAKSSGGSFPVLGVNGRYYRLMTSPSSVPASLLGACLGEVREFTTEPALAGTDVMMSNHIASGTPVYEISGMGGTLVAAEVDGQTKLFQRVSFNGSALRGGESLGDTLQIAGRITMMELCGVGTVTDRAMCEQLFATLVNNASYENSGSISGQQSLLIELDNGLTVQLLVKNDKLSACGVWSCPEFFDAFQQALE